MRIKGNACPCMYMVDFCSASSQDDGCNIIWLMYMSILAFIVWKLFSKQWLCVWIHCGFLLSIFTWCPVSSCNIIWHMYMSILALIVVLYGHISTPTIFCDSQLINLRNITVINTLLPQMATLLLADCLQAPTTAQRPKGVSSFDPHNGLRGVCMAVACM